jgi:hypothetical protein
LREESEKDFKVINFIGIVFDRDYNIFNLKLGTLDKLQLRGYMIEWITQKYMIPDSKIETTTLFWDTLPKSPTIR